MITTPAYSGLTSGASITTGEMIFQDGHVIKEIKTAVHELIYNFDDLPKPNYSEYISKKVNSGYNQISTIFSEKTGNYHRKLYYYAAD